MTSTTKHESPNKKRNVSFAGGDRKTVEEEDERRNNELLHPGDFHSDENHRRLSSTDGGRSISSNSGDQQQRKNSFQSIDTLESNPIAAVASSSSTPYNNRQQQQRQGSYTNLPNEPDGPEKFEEHFHRTMKPAEEMMKRTESANTLSYPDSLGGGSSDNDGSNLDSDLDQSNISGGTGSSASKALSQKSTLPLGMKMPTLMTIVILVPILFLIIYTVMPLSEAASAMAFLEEHDEIFTSVRRAGSAATLEYLSGSGLIRLRSITFVPNMTTTTTTTTTTEAPELENASGLLNLSEEDYEENMLNARRNFDFYIKRIRHVLDSSSLDRRTGFKDDLNQIDRDITSQRERLDAGVAVGYQYRNDMVEIILRLTRLLLYFGNDPRGDLLRVRIQNYCILRRLDTMAQNMLISARNIIEEGKFGQGKYDVESGETLRSRFDAVQTDLSFLLDSSDDEIAAIVRRFARSERWADWVSVVQNMLSKNVTKFAHYTYAVIDERNTEVDAFINELDRVVLLSINDGSLLTAVVRDESLKMIFAIIACIVALVAVIHYNNKEQARLERALDATAVLASAVQRFVPRNQLKTMGVRSITQVQPGMSTEVAQTITFSDIREFTRLSESMSRLELFDWLQNYVSRMTKVVSEEKSYIMAFLGDGLGICSPQPTYAINAAIKMHVAVEGLNLDIIAKNGDLPVKIGVGIHHGVVVAGVFGDGNRLSCTMIAPDVNFASRLEALTKSFGVKTLISESVVDQISSDVFLFRNVGKVQVKGSSKAVPVYDLYQTDNLDVKKFKIDTKKSFEEAISMIDTDREKAAKELENLYVKSRMVNVHDLALEMHYDRIKMPSPANDGQNSVLSFEKDGALKTSSNNALGPSASFMQNTGSFSNTNTNIRPSSFVGLAPNNEGSPLGPFQPCVPANSSGNNVLNNIMNNNNPSSIPINSASSYSQENSVAVTPIQLSHGGSPVYNSSGDHPVRFGGNNQRHHHHQQQKPSSSHPPTLQVMAATASTNSSMSRPPSSQVASSINNNSNGNQHPYHHQNQHLSTGSGDFVLEEEIINNNDQDNHHNNNDHQHHPQNTSVTSQQSHPGNVSNRTAPPPPSFVNSDSTTGGNHVMVGLNDQHQQQQQQLQPPQQQQLQHLHGSLNSAPGPKFPRSGSTSTQFFQEAPATPDRNMQRTTSDYNNSNNNNNNNNNNNTQTSINTSSSKTSSTQHLQQQQQQNQSGEQEPAPRRVISLNTDNNSNNIIVNGAESDFDNQQPPSSLNHNNNNNDSNVTSSVSSVRTHRTQQQSLRNMGSSNLQSEQQQHSSSSNNVTGDQQPQVQQQHQSNKKSNHHRTTNKPPKLPYPQKQQQHQQNHQQLPHTVQQP